MKTWEMIKELTENPKKKFNTRGVEDGSYVTVVDGYIVWEGENQSGQNFIVCLRGEFDEWKEVKEPVDFMTAFKAWDEENKTIICQLDKDNTVKYEGNRTNFNFHAECIRRNEWYIED